MSGTSLILSCLGDNELTFVNPSTGAFGSPQLVTGRTDFGAMAYDATDNTIWSSADVASTVNHNDGGHHHHAAAGANSAAQAIVASPAFTG